MDLFSRRVADWATSDRLKRDLAVEALRHALVACYPAPGLVHHSDKGSQVTSREWQLFPGPDALDASMSRRCTCRANAVAESFFPLMKRDRIRRRTYLTQDVASQDVFDDIEIFYNPTRKRRSNGMLSPVDFETR